MTDIVLAECNEEVPCVDCENKKCAFQGKLESDCPKYRCDRTGEGFMNCDNCGFIKHYLKEVYYDCREV